VARVDYYAIEKALQTLLQADATLTGTTVTVEAELMFGAEAAPWVGIYLDRRDAPADMQGIGAGISTRMLCRFSIWCWAFTLESIEEAIHKRDDILGKVEVALMKNRTITNNVSTSWLEGGEMPSGRIPGNTGFMSGGEVVLVADVKATTV